MRYSMKLMLIPAMLLAWGLIGVTAFEGAASGQGRLQPHQGRYFKWAAPAGWRVSESNAGVTLMSPDGRFAASLASLMRSRGTRTRGLPSVDV